MYPELISYPVSIKTYGFCMMIGFLSAVWFAMRRAERVKANPDTVLNLAFVALLAGVAGARLFFVAHYWQTDFVNAPNVLLAVVDIRRGGLEFLGGLLGAIFAIVIYLVITKQSTRLYLDIMAPGTMWGLAFGRIGCFFNGCCYGSVCIASGAPIESAPAWSVQFPYHASAYSDQWEHRQITVPAELIVSGPNVLRPFLLPDSPPDAPMRMSEEELTGPAKAYNAANSAYKKAKADDPNSAETKALEVKRKNLRAVAQANNDKHFAHQIAAARQYPSRNGEKDRTSLAELVALADGQQSLPVHPTQLYSSIQAILLAAVLSGIFYWRKRHGVTAAMTMVLYPIGRILLELIRIDNPHDSFGLTISQFVGLAMSVFGLLSLVVLFKVLPERSPRALAFVPEPPESKRARGG